VNSGGRVVREQQDFEAPLGQEKGGNSYGACEFSLRTSSQLHSSMRKVEKRGKTRSV